MPLRNWWRRLRKKIADTTNLDNVKRKFRTRKQKKKLGKLKDEFQTKQKKKFKAKKPKQKISIVTLYKKKKISSKINVRDIELIDGLDVKDLKKRYNVKRSKHKVLEDMVQDYKHGRLSLPGLSHKSKFHAKDLDGFKLDQIIMDYDTARKRKNVEDLDAIKDNIELLKKKFKLTPSRKKLLEKMLNDLKTANRSEFELVKSQLNPKILDKHEVDKLLAQYEAGQKQNRGISYLFTKSKLSFLASKRKLSALMQELKSVNLSDYLY